MSGPAATPNPTGCCPTAYAEFGGLQGEELLHAVRNWVFSELRYVSGSSRGTDGAVETLLHRRGVCRDFAHLAISLLRVQERPGPAGRRVRARD